MIKTVFLKEVREIVRDGRLRLLGALVLILTVVAMLFGAQQTQRAQEARENASERAAKQWVSQGEKNPHVAGHYGTHVFAPTNVATAVDPGVSRYLGRSVKMEAHKRNLAAHAEAGDGAGLELLGAFSVASILLELVPLLIIALGHGLWSRERERGTLRQVMSLGVERSVLFWGKSLALGAMIVALLAPAALLVIGVLWNMGGGDSQTLIRLALMGLSYLAYFMTFGALTLFASAKLSSSRGALVALVGLWGLFTLVIPRVATEVSIGVQPLPSRAELAREIGAALEDGIDGKMNRDTAVEAIIGDLMAEQDLANTGMLVMGSDVQGIELRAEAKWEDMIYDHFVVELEDQIATQERLVTYAGFFSPLIAMRSLSASLAGTDYAHHRHFTDRAEVWRKVLIGHLNKEFADNAGDDSWEYKVGADFWKTIPPFEYDSPSPGFALQSQWLSLSILALWLVGSFGLALSAAGKVRVVQ